MEYSLHRRSPSRVPRGWGLQGLRDPARLTVVEMQHAQRMQHFMASICQWPKYFTVS